MDFRKKLYPLALIPALFVTFLLAADDGLPSLGVDSNITIGTLDNGTRYYLATNSSQRGLVDMALVQKAGIADEGTVRKGESIVMARGAVAELPRFSNPTPFDYLQHMGIFPGPKGYMYVSDDATVYDFRDFMVSQTSEAVDSTLLMFFDIMESQSSQSPRYPPGNQAIIIAGDIDASSIVTKMNVLSMLVPKRTCNQEVQTYNWVPSDSLRFRFNRPRTGEVSNISFCYDMPRLSRENMGSVQSLVTRKLAKEVGVLIRKRLSESLIAGDIPFSGLKCVYRDGANGPTNESFSVSLNVDCSLLPQAASLVAGVLAEIDANGIDIEEYQDVSAEAVMDQYYKQTELTNADYVDRCVSAFLYGSSLASPQDESEFFAKRNVASTTNASLLSRYASALLDREKNLSIECGCQRSDSLEVAIVEAFRSGWKAVGAPHKARNSDTLALSIPMRAVKLRKEIDEPMTGGKIWTFSNGMQVIFKQVDDDDGVFSFNFLLRSGYARSKGLNPGEFAYLDDVIGVCDIGGIDGHAFSEVMLANGIGLDTKMEVSDVSISGTAPSSRMMLVLKALIAICYDSKPNAASFDYYRRCQNLSNDMDEEGLAHRGAIIDSLLAPGYEYIPTKKGNELPDDFPYRADDFFDFVFSRANDGVLILVGDLDEIALKKTLCQYLGSFHTDNGVSFRARTDYIAPGGMRTRKAKGSRSFMDLAYSLPFNYTTENYMSANVASLAVHRVIASAAASAGWCCNWESEFVMFPDERMNLYFHLTMSDKNGLPASMIQGDSVEEVARRVDAAVKTLSKEGINDGQLNTYVSLFGDTLKARMSESNTLMEMLVLRYSYGKDLMTNYEDRLKDVDRGRVNELLASLDKGCAARYIVAGPAEEELILEPRLEELTYALPDSLEVGAGTDASGMAKLYWRLFHGMYEDEPDERIDVTKLWVPEPLPEPKPEPLQEQEEEPSLETEADSSPSLQSEDNSGSYDEAGLDKIEETEDIVDEPEEDTDEVSQDEIEGIENNENL